MLEKGEYFPLAASTAAKEVGPTFLDSLPLMAARKKKNKNKNKKRFSNEQIKALESMFESESKLEPRKKLQLARELGLQPRQIAIWFQNRRARWKSKQIERDYNILRANYDALEFRFESLKKEHQTLLVQLQKLRDQLEKPGVDNRWCGFGLAGNNTEGNSDNRDARCEAEVKSSLPLEVEDCRVLIHSDDKNCKNLERFGEEEPDLNIAEPADGSLTSSENWCSFDSGGLFDRSYSDSQWWDVWS